HQRPAPARSGRPTVQPQLESLEGRLAPATHIWNGAGPLWSLNADWSNGSPFGDPGASVIFPLTSAQKTTSFDTPALKQRGEIHLNGSFYSINDGPPGEGGGGAILLQGDTLIDNSSPEGPNWINVPIDLEPFYGTTEVFFDHVFKVANGSSTLVINGPIT